MGYTASVIIPVYNAENDIVRCVESLVYGEFKDIEVILVEDCSKDNSWAVCQRLSDRYENVYCYQNNENKGVSYTRNRGLEKACGDYILFVDSDDWVSGRYANVLIKKAKANPDALVICGCHFHDDVLGYRQDFIWEKQGESEYIIKKNAFFDIPKRFHLQQLWNKVFRRAHIYSLGIRFDENQSMGEDYQFVLDYLEGANIQECLILNEPLYYYIRANENTLMSKFGLIETDNEYRRLEQLLRICGMDNDVVISEYFAAVREAKENFLYQAVRAKSFSKKQKLTYISSVMQDGREREYYFQQSITKSKEKIIAGCKKISAFLHRVALRLRREKNKIKIKRFKRKLLIKEFTIISQNCIAGVLYHDLKMPFLSPTINLFFSCPDFIKFVQKLDHYLETDLIMTWGEEYPIGYLDDIAIHFMHYHTCEEAEKKWIERKSRINKNKIIILSTDMVEFDKNAFFEWKKIAYPKLLFSACNWEDESVVNFPKYAHQGKVSDLISKREFYKNDRLADLLNMYNQ